MEEGAPIAIPREELESQMWCTDGQVLTQEFLVACSELECGEDIRELAEYKASGQTSRAFGK